MSELTASMIWSYQVALPDDAGIVEPSRFCHKHDLSLRVYGPSVEFEGQRWSVFCFMRHADADYFRVELRGRWIHTHLWRSND